jgi:hemoglobin-like flavoprotein
MTNEDILLVQSSWRKVLLKKYAVAELFYLKLFETDPSLRALFNGDMEQQGKKLMQMIGAAVRGLDRLDALLPVVRELGTRHVAYGVSDDQYGTVGTALLWTLETVLRKDFTPEVKSAWIKTYGVLSHTMREAAVAQGGVTSAPRAIA